MLSVPCPNRSRRPATFGMDFTETHAFCRGANGTYSILKGNLAPGGAVAKITGKEGLGFTGKARAFDSEDEFVAAVESGSIKKGEKTVVVLRYLGPKGGPGQSPSHVRLLIRELRNLVLQACRRCLSPPA